MTQLLQKDALGHPSVILTFEVRILALGLGIAIALICNFLFSILYYRKLGKRRLEFVKIQGVIGLKKTKEVLLSNEPAAMSYQPVLAGVFNDIEMVKANLETMMKESQIPFNAKEKLNLKVYYQMIIEVKTMIHLAYDMLYLKGTTNQDIDPSSLNQLDEVITGLQQLDFTDLKRIPTQVADKVDPSQFPKSQSRLCDNLNLLAYHYQTMISQLALLK
jgi:hypothetical protein